MNSHWTILIDRIPLNQVKTELGYFSEILEEPIWEIQMDTRLEQNILKRLELAKNSGSFSTQVIKNTSNPPRQAYNVPIPSTIEANKPKPHEQGLKGKLSNIGKSGYNKVKGIFSKPNK